MEKEDIENVLKELSKKRQIFYSEGDFQFSLGCEIQSLPNMKVIAEKPMKGNNDATEHIDMFVYNDQTKIGIELKYIKDKFSGKVGDNYYKLSPSLAYDLKCYDILKDIQRLENYVENKNVDERIDIGYSIVLTNAKNLWTPEANEKESNYDEFRVYDERTLQGTMNWKPETGEGTKKKHSEPISLTGTYPIHWQIYSEINIENQDKNQSNNTFKYMIFEIRNKP